MDPTVLSALLKANRNGFSVSAIVVAVIKTYCTDMFLYYDGCSLSLS